MASRIVLLRGINLPGRNRISMPALRAALAQAGFDDVRTYLQSGNVVLSSGDSPEAVAAKVERVIADELGLDVAAVVRTRAELASIVKRNPLQDVATNPKRYQVTFLGAKPEADALRALDAAVTGKERLVHSGRELYAWHPDGIGRSKLAALLVGPRLGVVATSRNWTTVTALLDLAGE